MRFRIDGVTYDAESVREMHLRDILVLERETEVLGRRLSYEDLMEGVTRLAGLPVAEADRDPMAMWVFAITVWVARRHKGEDVTLEQAIDVPMSKLEILPDPQDHMVAAGPTRPPRKGAKKKAPTRPASAPVSAPEL